MLKTSVCILMILSAALKLNAQNSFDDRAKEYIEQYKDWAITEQKRSGVPAAITLAQGIHETNAGNSELALNAHNHFGIKCKKEWNGETYAYTDDAPDECFRKYPSALQSYKDHSDYLAGSKRYQALFKLSIKDYKGWAQGLKRCGYATNPKYSQILIRIIEKYNLQDYTYAALSPDYNPVSDAEDNVESLTPSLPAPITTIPSGFSDNDAKPSSLSVYYDDGAPSGDSLIENPAKPEYGTLVKMNGIKAFYAKKGTVLLEDAFNYKIRYAKLLEINDLPDLPLPADMYIYLDKKNAKGIHETHVVQKGETLLQIAQAEGMQLRYLKFYNRIGANEEPAEGAILLLQRLNSEKPATYIRDIAENTGAAIEEPGNDPASIQKKKQGEDFISKEEIAAAQNMPLENPKERTAAENIEPGKKEEQDIIAENTETAPEETAVAETPGARVHLEEEEEDVAATETTAAPEPQKTIPADTEIAWIETRPPSETEIVKDTIQAPAEETVAAASSEQPEEKQVLFIEEKSEPVMAAPETAPKMAQQATEPAPAPPEEPKDPFDRLKAKLDKVVYAESAATGETENTSGKKDSIQTKTKDASKMYTVKKGDTAFGIAKKHNITMRQLMEWNKLDFKTIKAGQKLRVKP